AAEVPHSPAYDADEALEDPQAKHLRIAVTSEHAEMGSFTTVRPPYSFDDTPEYEVLPPPTLDEHGDEIRAELNSARKAS
ncbi:MAG: crotonobetainyl-CoA:carnitine CoA-transferase CaiB-like acyl-CoA transferase, partial [Sulfitobacter sp.]